MGCLFSSRKLLTPEHLTIRHAGKHSEKNCLGKHCTVSFSCKGLKLNGHYCYHSFNACADCLKINKIQTVRCSSCCSEIYVYRRILGFYDKEADNFLRSNHKCNNYLKTQWLGPDGWSDYAPTGSYYSRCTLCFENRCYRCKQSGMGSPCCRECSSYFTPHRICEHCHHDHMPNTKCDHETKSYGTVSSSNYYTQNGFVYDMGGTTTIDLSTKCSCLL